jgi:hypothetical protein
MLNEVVQSGGAKRFSGHDADLMTQSDNDLILVERLN